MKHRKQSKGRVIAPILCLLLIAMMILPVSATVMGDARNGVRDAVSDVGDAVSDVGGALSEAVTDMMDGDNGKVSDNDGVIGNENSETEAGDDDGEDRSIGWIGVVIALAVVAVILTLIIFLVPKKRR